MQAAPDQIAAASLQLQFSREHFAFIKQVVELTTGTLVLFVAQVKLACGEADGRGFIAIE